MKVILLPLLPALSSLASHRRSPPFLCDWQVVVRGLVKTSGVRTQAIRTRAVEMVVSLVVLLNSAREVHGMQLRRLIESCSVHWLVVTLT
jgi:hypothetical protein